MLFWLTKLEFQPEKNYSLFFYRCYNEVGSTWSHLIHLTEEDFLLQTI